MMRIRDRLIKGTAFNMIAVAFNQGSALLANIIVARILMKQGFGEYAMVQSTLLMVSTLSQLSTGFTASKYIAEHRSSDPEKAGRIMGMCALASFLLAGVGTTLLVAMAPWLAGGVLNAPHLTTALTMGSGFLFFSSINGYQTGALAGLEAYGSLAKAGVASGIMALATISFGAWWGGLNGTLLGLSMSAFVRCAIHNRFLRLENRKQEIKPQYRDSLNREKEVLHDFALPITIAAFYSMLMVWLAYSFLVRQPEGYEEMAFFSAANNIRVVALFFPNVIYNVGVSILNNEKSKGDLIHYIRVFKSNLVYIILASMGSILFMGVFGPPILRLFGKDFGAANFLLWLLLASSFFEGLSVALYQYLQSKAKIWLSFFSINAPRDTFLVVAAYYLVQSHGGAGLAIAYLGSTILGLIFHFCLVVFLYRREIKGLGSYAAVQ